MSRQRVFSPPLGRCPQSQARLRKADGALSKGRRCLSKICLSRYGEVHKVYHGPAAVVHAGAHEAGLDPIGCCWAHSALEPATKSPRSAGSASGGLYELAHQTLGELELHVPLRIELSLACALAKLFLRRPPLAPARRHFHQFLYRFSYNTIAYLSAIVSGSLRPAFQCGAPPISLDTDSG
jgi:hypothetical protein